MFFKREPREQPLDVSNSVMTVADKPVSLTAKEVRRSVDPATLGFETTKDLEPISGLIGQDRALKAIQFGADIKSHDFNMFVLGPPASGKTTAVKAYLAKKASTVPTPDDWVYVNNFEDHNRPLALQLPPGRGRELAKGMVGVLDDLRATLPTVFESEEFQVHSRTVNEQFRLNQEEAFEALNQKALSQNVAILKTPTGFTMAPMADGKVVKPETFNSMPDSMRKDVEERIEKLQAEMVGILEQLPKLEKQRRTALKDLTEETATIVVGEAFGDLKRVFGALPDVSAHLATVEENLIKNVGMFLSDESEGEETKIAHGINAERDPRFRPYLVNVMISHEQEATGDDEAAQSSSQGAPIFSEPNPNYGSLIGRIEHIAQMGTLMTDFLLIKPGALHKANGGFLLLDARKVLLSPFAWEALKRAIKGQEIRIEQPEETVGFATTQSLEPAPIPLSVKVILFGDRQLYYLLAANDPDFAGLFKVQADFDDSIARSSANDRSYARIIRSITDEHELKPVDAAGVARLIDEGARLASDRERLSIEIGRLADIVREADYWAGEAGHDVITRDDVDRAIAEHVQRSDRLRDKAQEQIDRGIMLVTTRGETVGQINGLSVLQLGDFAFGKPTRITASVRLGAGRVTDIEREVELGGPLHSKGVMILWGFLAAKYAQDAPLSLAASLVFEQSYGGVDGDSASSAELYALMSALSGVPIRQSLAVTGSVNQWGQVQAIGGANEKIEGFFDTCKAQGLSGEQGVLIPHSNVQHLMLRTDVVEAIGAGKFSVYAVSSIDQGIEILTGVKAGTRGEDGRFPAGTVNRLVEDRLRIFAEKARSFARPDRAPWRNGAISQ